VFRRYATRMEYFRIEDEARVAGRGLWSDPHPVPPWEWRRRPGVRS
jgi:endonuclease YncB( thermonuclease family)